MLWSLKDATTMPLIQQTGQGRLATGGEAGMPAWRYMQRKCVPWTPREPAAHAQKLRYVNLMALNYDVTPGRRLDASAHAVFKTRRSETHSAEIHQCMQKEFEECSHDEHRRYVHLARKHRWRGSTPVRVRFVPRTQMVLRRP